RAGEIYDWLTRSFVGVVIRFGFAPSLGREFILIAIGTFVEAFRGVRFDLHDCSTQEMWAGLRENRLDLILEVATQDPEIQWHPLMQRQFRIAMKAEHPHAGRRQLSPSEIDGERILLLSRRDYPGYWEQVTTYFESQGINAQVAGEFDGQESLSLAVKAGLGIAFVAEGHDLGESVISLPLVPAPEPICVALGWLADRELKPWIADFVSVFPEAPGEPLSSFHAGTVGQEGG
ncbi:MAG: LysR family substrate-binding domain-containing protein, partial [Verrucomicrobiota bacterium]